MRKPKRQPEALPPQAEEADLNDSPLEAMPAAARLALLAWSHNDHVKARAVALVLINEENGATIEQVARLMKLPRQTVGDWVAAWKRDRRSLLKTLIELQGNVERLKVAEEVHRRAAEDAEVKKGDKAPSSSSLSSGAPSLRGGSGSARPRSSPT